MVNQFLITIYKQGVTWWRMSSQPSLGSPASIAQIPSCYPAIHHLYLWDVPVLVSHPRPFFSGLIFLVAITRTYPNMTESWKYGTPPQEGQLARIISGIWKNRFPATQRSRTHLKNFKAQHRLHAMIISSMVLHSLYVTIDDTEEWKAQYYHDRFVDDDQRSLRERDLARKKHRIRQTMHSRRSIVG